MIIDGSFELDFVNKGTPHNGMRTDYDGFKPFWEVQYLSNCNLYTGSKQDCIEWIAWHYIDHFNEESRTEAEAEKKSLAWVIKCLKEAEAKELS